MYPLFDILSELCFIGGSLHARTECLESAYLSAVLVAHRTSFVVYITSKTMSVTSVFVAMWFRGFLKIHLIFFAVAVIVLLSNVFAVVFHQFNGLRTMKVQSPQVTTTHSIKSHISNHVEQI